MKKINSCILLFLIGVSVPLPAYAGSKNNYDYYINLEKDYKIDMELHYRKYKIQTVLEVPKVEILVSGEKDKILSYRTEFHNGTENGCLKVFNRPEGGKMIPFFVLEELFYISKTHYYQRVVTELSYNKIGFDLYEIREQDKNKILSVILERKNERDFKMVSFREFRRGFSEGALFFSDVYENLKGKILSGSY